MSKTVQIYSGIPYGPELPIYHVAIRARSGAVHNVLHLPADDDEQAREQARTMVDSHAVELWDGLRFVDRFAPVA